MKLCDDCGAWLVKAGLLPPAVERADVARWHGSGQIRYELGICSFCEGFKDVMVHRSTSLKMVLGKTLPPR